MEQSYRFSVAPMLDCTDRHFRVLMRQISRHALLYSEMVVARAVHHILQDARADSNERQRRLERLLGCDPIERPLSLQLGGDDPKILAQTAALAAEWGYDEVNLNVGCPSAKVVQGRFGACLMAEPERVADCVAAMVQASGLPVTVKHRIGIDARDSFAELVHFVDTVASGGASRFSVHARKAWLKGLDPHQNRTVPPLRWDLVQQLKQARPGLLIELNGALKPWKLASRCWPGPGAPYPTMDPWRWTGSWWVEPPTAIRCVGKRWTGSCSASPERKPVPHRS